jgi:uncharacterized protein (UPF0335 family)
MPVTIEQRVTTLESQQANNASKSQLETVSDKVGSKYNALIARIEALESENDLLKAQLQDILSRVADLES